MTKLNDTFSLVQSLTKNEKRYVSLHIKMKKKSEPKQGTFFAELFDSLISVEEEESLKTKAQDPKKRLSGGNLLRLYDFVMDCLKNYNAEKPEFKAEDYLQRIRILRDKGLYSQANSLIKKARKEIIDKFELDIKTCELILLQRNINLHKGRQQPKEVIRLREENQTSLENISLVLDTFNDFENNIESQRKGQLPKKVNHSRTTTQLLKDPQFADKLPFNASLYGLIVCSDFRSSQDIKDIRSLHYIKKLVFIFEKNENRIRRDVLLYINVLNKLFYRSFRANVMGDLELILGKVNSLLEDPSAPYLHQRAQTQVVPDLYNMFMIFYLANRRFDKALEEVSRAARVLTKYKGLRDSIRLTLHLNITIIYLLNRMYKETREWLDKLNSIKKNNTRKDINLLSDLLEIILLYETGQENPEDLELAEAKIGTILIRIRDYDPNMKKLARSFLSNMTQALYSESDDEKIGLFRRILEGLPEGLALDRGFQGFRYWAEQKIENLEGKS